MLDTPWKIATLVGVLIALRILVGSMKSAPNRAFLVELLNSALIAFALVFLLIRPFLLQAFFIPSGSMEPTLHQPSSYPRRSGDRILVNKFIYRLGSPRRGDIVVFKAPLQAYRPNSGLNGAGDFLIKRVIGLPGEKIQVRRGEGVFINGSKKPLPEPYLPKDKIPNYDWPVDNSNNLLPPYEIPEGHILVMGDNRNNSYDSHLWRDQQTGEARPALPLKNVMGRSLIIFWPLDRIGRLTH